MCAVSIEAEVWATWKNGLGPLREMGCLTVGVEEVLGGPLCWSTVLKLKPRRSTCALVKDARAWFA
uniref:Uncharacterized protein n=1 Tax=Manihot esculenta TaxID=3983 RepID=A0A2C9WHV6_MANES